MERFLDTYDHPKLNQKDINPLNKSVSQNEIEAAIKTIPQKKAKDLMDSLMNSIRP
jgi:NADH/NAD ratio-sensing transcriptional regulator Rex